MTSNTISQRLQIANFWQQQWMTDEISIRAPFWKLIVRQFNPKLCTNWVEQVHSVYLQYFYEERSSKASDHCELRTLISIELLIETKTWSAKEQFSIFSYQRHLDYRIEYNAKLVTVSAYDYLYDWSDTIRQSIAVVIYWWYMCHVKGSLFECICCSQCGVAFYCARNRFSLQ